jgi:xanthine dehydrogenase small subunit
VDRFFAPRSLEAFARLRQAHPEARLLAGSTDVGLWVTKQFRDLGDLLWIGQVAALRDIGWHQGDIDSAEPGEAASPDAPATSRWMELGAAVSLQQAWAALGGHWPSLSEVGLRFAGPSVRHAGTLGGNLANGSPIGDSAPVLMALDTRLVLRRGDRRRVLRLDAFYLDYMKNELAPGEFLEAIRVPDLGGNGARGAEGGQDTVHHLRAWKISKRFDCDISALCAGIRLTLRAGVVDDVRLAFGGMAATVRRAQGAEAALRGQPWNEQTLQAACAALDTDFSPLSDLRASAAYRRQAARGLLRRLWLQTRPDDPLPPEASTVWAREVTA